MNIVNHFWRTLSLRDRKFNSFNLVLLFTFASFIGAFGIILPSLFSGINESNSLDLSEGSNLGYEEMIRTYVDQHGNVTVLGSFHGPQVTPNVNWALPGYDLVWQCALIALNTNTTDYYYNYLMQTLDEKISKNDVYLYFMFYTEESWFKLMDPTIPIISSEEMLETAAILKDDFENAFGIANNFSVNPIAFPDYPAFGKVVLYGFNYSAQTDYNDFIQFFSDNTPAGLADSFSPSRIANTQSWFQWLYSTNWTYGEYMVSPMRSPFGDYTSSFECNINLLYPQHFSPYNAGSHSLNLSEFLDAPFTPLVNLNESAFSSSEIDFVVENGNITSPTSSSYHIPQFMGLDQDYWLLLNASFYDTYVDGYGAVSDIQCDFEYYVVDLNFIQPTPGLHQGDVNIEIRSTSNLTNVYGSMLICYLFDEATFNKRIFDDNSYASWYENDYLEMIFLIDAGSTGNYTGMLPNSYKYPNGNYVLYAFSYFNEFSSLNSRTRFSGGGIGAHIYNYTMFTLNNPGNIVVDVLNPQPYDVLTNTVDIIANITGPELISLVDYYVYNYTGAVMGGTEIFNGSLIDNTTHWIGTMDTTQLKSTANYILRLKITDFNGSELLYEIPFTANNTFYQENVQIYAPMGGDMDMGYDLQIGTIVPPIFQDPMVGGSGIGGPMPHSFFGYGVSFGMEFNDHLYEDVWAVFTMADNTNTENPLWQMIGKDIPTVDYGVTVMMPDASPASVAICDEIANRAAIAFNLPQELTYLGTYYIQMGGGNESVMIPFLIYGDNYTTNNYGDFVDKFHASIPTGLAGLYSKTNMTQTNLNSTLFFGWINPDGMFGEQIYQYNPLADYNCGEMAYISPTIIFPDYFDNTLAQPRTVSLNTLFPQISQINACSPGIASAILSGFGNNMLGYPAGIITLNANITDWYPQSPAVLPYTGFIAPNFNNILMVTMLDTLSGAPGLITTDELNFTFTGPFVTNEILTPTEGQSIELLDANITITSQCVTGQWNETRYQLQTIDGYSGYGNNLIYTGSNWTALLNSSQFEPGLYDLITYTRSNDSMWAINETRIYINNTISLAGLAILIDDWGNVEISSGGGPGGLFYGYGVRLGIDTSIPEYYDPNIMQIILTIADENTSNLYSNMFTREEWDVFLAVIGNPGISSEALSQLMEPIVSDIERAFSIPPGQLQPIATDPETTGTSPSAAWCMNYTPTLNYTTFLDHYESNRHGNMSNVFSKQNMLKADESYLAYMISPFYSTMMGFPENLDWGEYAAVLSKMKFNNVFNYTQIMENHTFSLANLLGISELNTDYEKTMTYGNAGIMTQLICGNYTDIYPYDPSYTIYTGMFDVASSYTLMMLQKMGPMQTGFNSTDDVRFNFTAPYTLPEVLTPIWGSTVSGDVNLVVNATMSVFSTIDVQVDVYSAGSFMPIYGPPALDSFDIKYNPIDRCWSGIWETLDETVKNGWYDLVFTFTDNLSREQRAITRVHVENTYYSERLNVIIEQNGNITAGVELQGHVLDQPFDFSLPEYQEILMSNFIATNSYSGHVNFSKDLYVDWLGFSPFDYGFMVMVPQEMSDAQAQAIAGPIKDDYERAFGIIGELVFIGTGEMGIQTGMPEAWLFKYIAYGGNYTAIIKYDHFVDVFHQTTPNGLNNSVPASTLTGTDSLIQWVSFFSSTFSPIRDIPNMDPYHTYIMAKLFYPQYFGSNYMQNSLISHDLSLTNLLGVSELIYASNDVADSMNFDIDIFIENANITGWYPSIDNLVNKNGLNALHARFAVQNNFGWSNEYEHRIYDFGPLDDFNLTFVEPMSRPLILSPTMGAIVDGVANILVQVQNSTPIRGVYLKAYTVDDINSLDQNRLMGPNPTMPSARPSNSIYLRENMTSLGGGLWNYSYPVHVFPDGPFWFEVEVETVEGLWSYNNTQVNIANSNPLKINFISPSAGAIVSGNIELTAQIVNSSPVLGAGVLILDASGLDPITQIYLEPLGGDIYSGNFATHQLRNGTYQLVFFTPDYSGIRAINTTTINVANGEKIEVKFLHPTSQLDWSPQANITVEVSSPYPVKMVQYTINRVFYNPMYKMWFEDMTNIAQGVMLDPGSTWVAELDTTGWYHQSWDYTSGEWRDAYYEIFIVVSDLGGADGLTNQIYFSERFLLAAPEPTENPAVIIEPPNGASLSDDQVIIVEVSNLNDTLDTVNGEIRRAFDNVKVGEISFSLIGTNATAQIHTYAFPDDMYTITVFGTASGRSYTDTILVRFNNPEHHLVECITPVQWDTLAGPVLIQLDIENNTALQNLEIWIDLPWGGSTLAWLSLSDFAYNFSSGYWEALWNSTELVDGDYRMECWMSDINGIEDWDYVHFSCDNPPKVTILEPLPASNYTEYENIHFVVQIPDPDVNYVELWANGDYIMTFTQGAGGNWTADWSDTIGYFGAVFIEVFAYDLGGQVNNTEWVGININKIIPPAERADIYNATTTNDNGTAQTIFVENDTVEYHATIRGDAAGSSYVVTVQTDDPLLSGYLEYDDNVTVAPGVDFEIVFNYTIALGAPTGKYTVQILVWTDWPWDGGICVDFITLTFEVV